MNPDDLILDPDFDTLGGGWFSRSSSPRGRDGDRARRDRRKARRAKLAGRFAWCEVAA